MDFPKQTEEFSYDLYVEDLDITIEKMKGKSVLEVACGTDALFLKYCLRHDLNVFGMDFRSADRENKALLHARYLQGDIYRPPFLPESFDLIIMRAVLFQNWIKAFMATLALLKRGGELRACPFWLDDPQSPSYGIRSVLDDLDLSQFEVKAEIRSHNRRMDNKIFARYLLIFTKVR